jgi:response regulator RpfG family c-di-GMP phosphodiesterase
MKGHDIGLAVGDFANTFAQREGKPRVLVVDDQTIHLQLLHQLFQAECQVLVATSGERALALCREQTPDLVLLDATRRRRPAAWSWARWTSSPSRSTRRW